MENDILDSLNDLDFTGPLSKEDVFSKALDGGPKSLQFTKLIYILADQLKDLCNLEETVNMMNDPDESSSFLLELGSFLRELGCPYKSLTTGHMSSRLKTKEDRLLLLDYLISELMAAKMMMVDCPKDNKSSGMEIVVQETPTAKELKDILIALKFNKPPPSITPELLFTKLEAKLRETIQKEGEQLVGKPLYNKALTEKDWRQLEKVFTEINEEYRLRRETLITRLECTIQSFEWSDRLKSQKDVIQSTYRPKREQMKVKSDVKLSDFLAARTSLLLVEKTSSATVRKNTQTDVNKVIIGQVPDRGGRPHEQPPPPPEMPSWQQRSSAPQRGGGGGGGRGGSSGTGGGGRGAGGGRGGRGGAEGGRGGGGGRVQGGYSQGAGDQGRFQSSPASFNQNNRSYQTYEVPPGGYERNRNNSNRGGYDQNRGGYDHNRSGYDDNRGGYDQNRRNNSSGFDRGNSVGGYQTGYDSVGSYNQGYDQGGSGNSYNQGFQPGYQTQGYQSQNQGYHSRGGGGGGGYQHEHDDRRNRGGYRGGRR